MGIPLFQVDAFAAKAFAGNPAAVCLLEEEAKVEWMQSVAAEMNLSETAFLLPQNDGFGLRWVTPTTEVDLCGHATLASAHVLWEKGRLAQSEAAHFHTRSGLLTGKLQDDWIELDFPSTPADSVEPPPGLSDLVGSVPKYVGRSRFDFRKDGFQRCQRPFRIGAVAVTFVANPIRQRWHDAEVGFHRLK